MAQVNIKDSWWTDPRRRKLVKLLGNDFMADGLMVYVWRTALEYWSNERRTIPEQVFNAIEHSSTIVECGLAVVDEGSIYVVGTKEHLEWIHKIREKASIAGKASAESRRKKTGSAQPKPNNHRTSVEQHPNEPRTPAEPDSTKSNVITTSIITSNSISKSNTEEEGNVGSFPILPELQDDRINDVLSGISPNAQKRWLKNFKDESWIKDTLAETISFYTARGDEMKGQWAIRLHQSLQRAKAGQKNANRIKPEVTQEEMDDFFNLDGNP